MPPHREGCQLQYAELPAAGPAPESLAPLLDWLTDRLDQPTSVADTGESGAGVGPHPHPPLHRPARRQSRPLAPGPPHRAATRALLEETDLPVETIAHRVGLSSAVNLRRRFHEALRTTPAAYRRAFRTSRSPSAV